VATFTLESFLGFLGDFSTWMVGDKNVDRFFSLVVFYWPKSEKKAKIKLL